MNNSLNGLLAKRKSTRIAQKGFSLLELVIVVGIIALALYLVLNSGNSTSNKQTATNMNQGVTEVIQAASQIFPGNFAALTCDSMGQNSAFKGTVFSYTAAAKGAGATLWNSNNPNSTVACAPATLVTANDSFSLTLNAVPNEVCSQFVSKVTPVSWIITVNGTSVKALNGTLDPASLGTACTATTDANVVVITLARTNPSV